MAAQTVDSPRWWLTRGITELNARKPQLQRYEDYYAGKHRLLFASDKFASAFGGLFRELADNWMDLIVDAVEERLNIEGFRYPDSTEGDKDAWRIWQRNGLDADSQIAHVDGLIDGESHVLVWSDPADDTTPLITIEHAQSMFVFSSPENRRNRLAAVKQWIDDGGYLRANVYLPDGITKFQSRRAYGPASTELNAQWDETETLANPLGVVPVVPLRNRPRQRVLCESEIAKAIPVQDAVNKLVIDMLVASEFAAFPQRWATGLEFEEDPTTHELVKPFEIAIDKLLQSESPETRFGQFAAADLANYVHAIEMLVQHLASQTRTPPHYFYLSGSFPTGEAIKSAETGLVAKARRKMKQLSDPWEEVIRLAFAVLGDPRAEIRDAEVIWGDPESRSESEHVDALVKLKSLNVPDQQLWEMAGFSPQQISRFEAMSAAESLFAPTAVPEVPPVL